MLTTFEAESLPAGFALAWAQIGRDASTPRVSFLGDPLVGGSRCPLSDEVLCWTGTMTPSTDLQAFAGLAGFSEAEQSHMSALRRHEDCVAYAAAHGALRLILAALLACPPGTLRFEFGGHGKPCLRVPFGVREAVQFSISHSSGLAAVAVSRRAVGIDVEKVSWSEDLLEVAQSKFAAEHLDCLFRASGERRTGLFFRYWTLGEALIKATGMGLAQDLRGFAFTPEEPPGLIRLEARWGPLANWHFGYHSADVGPV